MADFQHADAIATKHPSGTRGVHGVEGFPAVADEAARNAIVQVAPVGLDPKDRGREVRQTGGATPGWYRADGAGGWLFLGDVGNPVAAHSPNHDVGAADPLATAAPVAVDRSANAAGSGPGYSLADHKHDVDIAAPVDVGTANAAGSGPALSASDHVHDHAAQTDELHHALVASGNHGFQPRSNRSSAVDPTVNDDVDLGYLPGSYWINTTADRAFFCFDNTDGAAVWRRIDNDAIKEIFTTALNFVGTVGDFGGEVVAANGQGRLGFVIPSDFSSLVSVEAVCFPTGTAASANVDLLSDYGATSTENSEVDSVTTQAFTSGVRKFMDLSPVLSSLDADDMVGVQIDHNAIGFSVIYFGVRLRYVPAL